MREGLPRIPTLSVVMPNYNHGRYIGEALEAVLGQSVPPLEVVVVDDGSTDDSVARIEAVAAAHPTVRLHRNERNRGVIFSVNRAVSLARGDFILSAAADDCVLPGLFEKSLSLLAQHPRANLCFTDFMFLDAATGELHPKHLGFAREAAYLDPEALVARLPRSAGSIPGCGTLFRREALQAAGGFRDELAWHCDWFASLAISFRGGCCYVPEPLSSFRFLSGSYSSGSREWADQRAVLTSLLTLLESEEFADVRDAFFDSGVLAVFGIGIVRAALGDRRFRRLVTRLPLTGVASRELKNAAIRLGSHELRKAFWELRHRWQTSRG